MRVSECERERERECVFVCSKKYENVNMGVTVPSNFSNASDCFLSDVEIPKKLIFAKDYNFCKPCGTKYLKKLNLQIIRKIKYSVHRFVGSLWDNTLT